MNDSIEEKRRFATLLVGLSDYYKQEISKAVLTLYWEGLRQYDYVAIEKACWAHTQSADEAGRWFPKIADLNKILVGRSEDLAALAWSKVDEAMRVRGTWDDIAFDDPLIHRCIADLGGWIIIGTHDDKQWPFTAKEFQTRYRGYKMRDETPPYPAKLTGSANAYNSANRQPLLPPIMFGAPEKVKLVIRGGSDAAQLGFTKPKPPRIE